MFIWTPDVKAIAASMADVSLFLFFSDKDNASTHAITHKSSIEMNLFFAYVLTLSQVVGGLKKNYTKSMGE